ncbi:hypothetical protein XENTR_v10001676 [Xenopus tropicalis]|nr:hypothetical protein XENTR_v10001676 [Xenopus tropicalis]
MDTLQACICIFRLKANSTLASNNKIQLLKQPFSQVFCALQNKVFSNGHRLTCRPTIQLLYLVHYAFA